MKPYRSVAALAVLTAGCSPAWPPSNQQSAQQTVQRLPADTNTSCVNHGAARAGCTSKPPVLIVGVSDPDTQLILPWFLTDIVNAVNTHESVSDFLSTIKSGF
jgi:hypothetical protein